MQKKKKLLKYTIVSIFIILLGYYMYSLLLFANRVKLLENEVKLGMTDIEVVAILGEPSHLYISVRCDEERKCTVFKYSGRWFLKWDIILYFDETSKRLVKKQRGFFEQWTQLEN